MTTLSKQLTASPFTVTCPDGRVLTATHYQATATATATANARLVLINSALGVKQYFYQAMAQFLANQGFIVVTWDARGVGHSALADPKTDDARMRDWGQIDLEAILNHIVTADWARWQDISIIGHSAGGHLVGLCQSITRITHIIMISSGTCYWRLYSRLQWPRMLSAWYLLMPTLARVFGYIPGKFGLGHDLPTGVCMDWRNWSLQPQYLFSDPSLGEHYYHSYDGKITALGFSDDVGFSPKKTVEHLMTKFPNASKRIDILDPQDINQKKVGHFGFFKQKNQQAWQDLLITALK